MVTIEDVIQNLKVRLNPEREKRMRAAYAFALKAHVGQKRRSGDEYIQHSLATALNVAKIGMRSKTIAAALLHDVPEDTDVTLAEIEKEFGQEIAFIVDGVTNLGKIKFRESKEDLYVENLRKMFLAMAQDIRVVIIKLADRLHNMETLNFVSPEKRQRIAKETMEIYTPIANRLGIGEIKIKLEDLSFKFLDPEHYAHIKLISETEFEARKKSIQRAIYELKRELAKEKIKILNIHGRTKSLYRLFKKMELHDMDINKVYDLAGVRVIVPTIASCYETLGIVHKKFRPMVGRIKDYISLPKPNGYQSIHTTIFGPDGKILEIQIRTQKMHDEAEFGIASHWIYSEQKQGWINFLTFRKKKEEIREELAWVKQLREWQVDLGTDNKEFIEGLKLEFFKNHILAFTPKGDIIDLPEDATPIDFAYRVHSEVGNRATGAKADHKMVPLDYKIKNGEMIEIITSKEKKSPNRDWLRFVRTSNAKSTIRKHLKKEGLI
ncbi:MAG: RelA/SpoT family protein [Candidatus Moranbacteria bacterium]|nr:RelA/SpoT family protein [Candidatus Moranbacteria bacterium]